MGEGLIFTAFLVFVAQTVARNGAVPFGSAIACGFALLVAAICALIPLLMTLIRNIWQERALKEREEERADMTAHLHDGVLQTLALIQLHADDEQQVFTLARSQERELRSWLYQERTTSDRSVSAGLQEIAAQVEDVYKRQVRHIGEHVGAIENPRDLLTAAIHFEFVVECTTTSAPSSIGRNR